MSNFALDLRKFAKKAGDNAEKVVRAVALDVTYSVVDMSPVDTGRFKNNWNVNVSSIDRMTRDTTDASGAASKARADSALISFTIGQNIYISNSLPYAQRLEDGYSKIQAPSGMVKVTLTKYQSFIKNAVRKL